jgi:hypothetical protein
MTPMDTIAVLRERWEFLSTCAERAFDAWDESGEDLVVLCAVIRYAPECERPRLVRELCTMVDRRREIVDAAKALRDESSAALKHYGEVLAAYERTMEAAHV